MTPDRIIVELQQATYDDLLDALTTCQLRDVWLWAESLRLASVTAPATRNEVNSGISRSMFGGDERPYPLANRLVGITSTRLGRLPNTTVEILIDYIESTVLSVDDGYPTLADWADAVTDDLRAEYQRRLAIEHETTHGTRS
jgi:hypothetical protein